MHTAKAIPFIESNQPRCRLAFQINQLTAQLPLETRHLGACNAQQTASRYNSRPFGIVPAKLGDEGSSHVYGFGSLVLDAEPQQPSLS